MTTSERTVLRVILAILLATGAAAWLTAQDIQPPLDWGTSFEAPTMLVPLKVDQATLDFHVGGETIISILPKESDFSHGFKRLTFTGAAPDDLEVCVSTDCVTLGWLREAMEKMR